MKCVFVALQEKFVLTDYTHTQPDLTAGMRGILIDWMVEVQVTSCDPDLSLCLSVCLYQYPQ